MCMCVSVVKYICILNIIHCLFCCCFCYCCFVIELPKAEVQVQQAQRRYYEDKGGRSSKSSKVLFVVGAYILVCMCSVCGMWQICAFGYLHTHTHTHLYVCVTLSLQHNSLGHMYAPKTLSNFYEYLTFLSTSTLPPAPTDCGM